jgi:competence ComEA-like helix-hairpin-helix protein
MKPRFLFARYFLPILFIALLFSPTSLAGKKKPPGQPVNINTANSEQLQLVPGIGPATADKILQMRKSYGAFKSVDDLLAIRGLGPKRLEKMRKYLTVGKAGVQHATPAKTCSVYAKPKAAPANSPPKATTPPTADPPDDEPTEPPRKR